MRGEIGNTTIMVPKGSYRIKLKELVISIRVDHNIQLIICRDGQPDLPHLTINWGNPTKNINVHLTTTKKNNQKEYQRIAQISELKLAELFESFKPELINIGNILIARARPVSPSWLRRRGYKILFFDKDAEKHLSQRIAPKQKHGRKKKKWAYIPDEQIIKNPNRLPEVTKCVHHPRKLRELAAIGYDKPIFAECLYGKRRGRLIALALRHKPDGEPYWISLNIELIQEVLNTTSNFVQSGLVKLLPSDALDKVYDALCLNEIGW